MQPPWFGVLAVVLGIAAGFGAYVLRLLIALIHNAAFLGELSVRYDANQHTAPGPLGAGIVVVPVVGAVLVVFLVRKFAPEAKGHGVPEVMDAIYYSKAVIRPIVAAIKSLASAISIGTGASVGREGPIIQIGAALGSFLGGLARVSRSQRATLVAAGGGAGIAATFNTPIGGVLFAVEVLMHEVSVRTLVPVALATTTATYVGRTLFGNNLAFPIPPVNAPNTLELTLPYMVLGGMTALASILFIRSLYGAEDLFERVIPRHPYIRHMVGMSMVGALFATFLMWEGHYHVAGIGYATIVDTLTSPQAIGFLFVLFAAKLLATSLTLGSGASGGIFSPSLFMGATLGAAFGQLVGPLFPGSDAPVTVFVLAGMAGMVSGATGAVLTSVVMLFEMTLDYSVVLPMAVTASVSYGLRRMFLADSIYTMKLSRRGHVMPEALQANAHLVHHVSDIVLAGVARVPVSMPGSELAEMVQGTETEHFVVIDDGHITGVFSREWALAHAAELGRAEHLGDVAPTSFVVVDANTTIFTLMTELQRGKAAIAVVVEGNFAADGQLLGVITKAHVAEALAEGMELFED